MLRNNRIIFLLLSVVIFIILLFVSTDSYLHGLYGKTDSSIFFMCGKAWMNGYIPYKEISDSKGPLLWLIYGMGYLLSHTDYTGVFWMTWLVYTFTFYYIYKIVSIFIEDVYLAFVTTIGMGLAFYNICVHNIIRSEDFCQLFVTISLYETCVLLYIENKSDGIWKKAAFIIGVCLACTLMIKFTITVMMAVFVLCVLRIAQNAHKMKCFIFWMLLGGIITIIPFIVYFFYRGCLFDFVEEYFFRTFSTVNNSEGNGMRSLFYYNVLVFNIILLFSVCFFSLQMRLYGKKRMFPLIAFLWFLFFTSQNAWNYYYNSLSVFFVFGLIALSSSNRIKIHLGKKLIIVLPLLLVMIIVPPIAFVPTIRDSFMSRNSEEAISFINFSNKIKVKKKPKLLYKGGIPSGVGVVAEALPACRFFLTQTGATADMLYEQRIAVRKNIADFIVIPKNDKDGIQFLYSCGYRQVENAEYHGTYLFALGQPIKEDQ